MDTIKDFIKKMRYHMDSLGADYMNVSFDLKDGSHNTHVIFTFDNCEDLTEKDDEEDL